MVDIVVGNGMFGGETRFNMPGAVGNTTSKFWDKGLVNVTLCDGPAGIRIQKRTALLPDGKMKMIDPAFSFFDMLPKFIKKRMIADPETSTVLYQFTTAFPVSAAMAQTWNTQLAYEFGLIEGAQAGELGIEGWYAPAANMHLLPAAALLQP